AAINKYNGVRAAHVFLAGRIKDFISVDYSLAGNGHIFDIVAHNERAMPLAPFGLGHERRNDWLRVLVQVRRPEHNRAVLKEQRYVTAQVNRAAEIAPCREAHLSSSGFGARLDGSIYGRRIKRDAVCNCVIITNVEIVRYRR